MKLGYFLKRHPILYSARFWLILKKPRKEDFLEEHCNKYVHRKTIPAEFSNEVTLMGLDSDESALAGAKKIIRYMNKYYGKGRGLGYSTVENLKALKAGKGGVCSDYSSVFTAFCLAKNIKVREWGLVANLKYKIGTVNLGHSFNEVFCDRLNKWVLLDPFFGIFFKNKETHSPLSATEFIDLHIVGRNEIEQVNFINGRQLNIAAQTKIDNSYFQENVFFLLKDYDIFSQDKILRMHKRLPLPLLHILLILTNKYFHYIIYLNSHNYHLMRNQLRKIFKFNYV